MNRRLELHEKLCGITGSRNVYFQPPESVKMKYPAVVYRRIRIKNGYANGGVYTHSNVYELTVIDTDPEGKIAETVSFLPKCRYDRSFVSDNLYHDVFTIIY
ncbi:MAG: hypothetical protein NC120_07185 [Ruminococcus sp.]|nr:hypothetical protein [Ruminococcus sp.]